MWWSVLIFWRQKGSASKQNLGNTDLECRLVLPDFNQNVNLSTNFSLKNPKYETSQKSNRWEFLYSMWTDRWIDTTKLTFAFITALRKRLKCRLYCILCDLPWECTHWDINSPLLLNTRRLRSHLSVGRLSPRWGHREFLPMNQVVVGPANKKIKLHPRTGHEGREGK